MLKAYLAAWRANPANKHRGRWVAALPEITRAANHSYTRAIGMTPMEAFPRVEPSRTVPGKGKLDLADCEDGVPVIEDPDADEEDEDLRRALLNVLVDVANAEAIVQKIIDEDLRAPAADEAPGNDSGDLALTATGPGHSSPNEEAAATAVGALPLVTSDEAAAGAESSSTQEPPTTGLQAAAAVIAVAPATAESQAADTGVSSDVEEGEDGNWESVDGEDILMWTEVQKKLEADDPAHPLDRLHIIARGVAEPLWFPQWGLVCPSLPELVRLVGVNAEGNCGPTAACSARLETFFKARVASEKEWQASRSTALDWLLQNRDRYVKLNRGRVAEVDGLVSQCRRDGAHVFVDFFRVYAWIHQLNVFVFTADVVVFPGEEVKLDAAKISSSFSCRLFNSLDDGATTLHSTQPNTIAVHLHHVHSQGKRGTGHFEFFVDSAGHSLWGSKASIVTECFQVACTQTRSFRRMHHYAERMILQETNREHGKLFSVGQLANLQVRPLVRKAVPGSMHMHQNMYVRLLDEPPSTLSMRRFVVLSHAGVLSELVPTMDLRVCGQDVDDHLLSRQMAAADLAPKKRVSLLRAWKLEVSRALASAPMRGQPAKEAASSTNAMTDENGGRGRPTTRSRSAASGAPSLFGPSSQPVEHVCGSCRKRFTLPAGYTVVRCIGVCQQTVHTTAEQCSRSRNWTRTPGVIPHVDRVDHSIPVHEEWQQTIERRVRGSEMRRAVVLSQSPVTAQ